ncbi:MAG: hypothetical protein HY372_03805 [Candidatus Andersenbacteria bacterium]|nr:hypothetical protein [Candidatus Andersenbacteria bacterium]
MDMVVQREDVTDWSFHQAQATRKWTERQIRAKLQNLRDSGEADERARRKQRSIHWIIGPQFMLHLAFCENRHWHRQVGDVLDSFAGRIILGLVPPMEWSIVSGYLETVVALTCPSWQWQWDDVLVIDGSMVVIRPVRGLYILSEHPQTVELYQLVLTTLMKFVPYEIEPFNPEKQAIPDPRSVENAIEYMERYLNEKNPLPMQREQIVRKWYRLSLDDSPPSDQLSKP